MELAVLCDFQCYVIRIVPDKLINLYKPKQRLLRLLLYMEVRGDMKMLSHSLSHGMLQ